MRHSSTSTITTLRPQLTLAPIIYSQPTPLFHIPSLLIWVTHSWTVFEFALQGYREKTGITLIEHPLAVQLQSCQSVESIIVVLQGQVQAFGEFRGIDRLMKSVRNTVSILTTLSTSASLGECYDLVRQNLKALMAHIAQL